MTKIKKEKWLTAAFFALFAVSWILYGVFGYAKAYTSTTGIFLVIAWIVIWYAWIILSMLIIREKKKNADLAERKKN